jgi:hypothetical protein
MADDLCHSIADGGLFDLSQRPAPRVSPTLSSSPSISES